MTKGPNREILDSYLDTAKEGRLTTAGNLWKDKAADLDVLADALTSAATQAELRIGQQTLTGPAVRAGMESSSASLKAKSQQLDTAGNALVQVGTQIEETRTTRDNLADLGEKPASYQAPANTTGVEPTPEELAAQAAASQARQAERTTWQSQYDKQEAKALALTKEMDSAFLAAIPPMKDIHGQEDPTEPPPSVPSGPQGPLLPGTTVPPKTNNHDDGRLDHWIEGPHGNGNGNNNGNNNNNTTTTTPTSTTTTPTSTTSTTTTTTTTSTTTHPSTTVTGTSQSGTTYQPSGGTAPVHTSGGTSAGSTAGAFGAAAGTAGGAAAMGGMSGGVRPGHLPGGSGSTSPARPIGATGRSGSAGALSRTSSATAGGAASRSGAAGTAAASRGGATGTAGSAAGRGSTSGARGSAGGRAAAAGSQAGSRSGGRGSAGARSAAAGAGAQGGRGGRKGERDKADERDSLVYDQDWLGDDDVAPGVLG